MISDAYCSDNGFCVKKKSTVRLGSELSGSPQVSLSGESPMDIRRCFYYNIASCPSGIAVASDYRINTTDRCRSTYGYCLNESYLVPNRGLGDEYLDPDRCYWREPGCRSGIAMRFGLCADEMLHGMGYIRGPEILPSFSERKNNATDLCTILFSGDVLRSIRALVCRDPLLNYTLSMFAALNSTYTTCFVCDPVPERIFNSTRGLGCLDQDNQASSSLICYLSPYRGDEVLESDIDNSPSRRHLLRAIFGSINATEGRIIYNFTFLLYNPEQHALRIRFTGCRSRFDLELPPLTAVNVREYGETYSLICRGPAIDDQPVTYPVSYQIYHIHNTASSISSIETDNDIVEMVDRDPLIKDLVIISKHIKKEKILTADWAEYPWRLYILLLIVLLTVICRTMMKGYRAPPNSFKIWGGDCNMEGR
mgnify:CR=1 FL=1